MAQSTARNNAQFKKNAVSSGSVHPKVNEVVFSQDSESLTEQEGTDTLHSPSFTIDHSRLGPSLGGIVKGRSVDALY